jgi:hypothetical protein
VPIIIENNGTTYVPDVVTDEVWYISVLLDLFPTPAPPGANKVLAGRLTIGVTEIPLKAWEYSESDQTIGATLTCELAHVSHRPLIDRDTVFDFETGERILGSWTWTTRMTDAKIDAFSYSLANNNFTPNDTFQFTGTPLLTARLDTTPLGTVVLYDPAKTDLDESHFIDIPDIEGESNPVTLTPIADFALFDVFNYVAAEMGFTGYQTNIPDFPLTRVDFPPGEPLWGTVAGIVGMFEPKLDIGPDDDLIIRDGTTEEQPDTVSALELGVDDVIQVGLSTEVDRFKGTLVTYQLKGTGWDYFEYETDTQSRNFFNAEGSVSTLAYLVTKNYYRNSFPNTPVKKELTSFQTFTYNNGGLNAATLELNTYNDNGLIVSKERRAWGKANAPQSWVTFCASLAIPGIGAVGPESSFTSASDDTFAFGLVLTNTDEEVYTYQAHPTLSDAVYMAYRETKSRGLITSDTEEQQLGEDFLQPLLRAQQSGNLKEGLGSYWGVTSYSYETQTPQEDGTVRIRTGNLDSLNNETGGLISPGDFEDTRVGDIAISILKPITKQVYVYTGADATATRILQLNGGEAPISILNALAERINARQYHGSTVEMPMPGFSNDIRRGRVIDPRVDGRQDQSLGIFRINGFSITGRMDNGVPSYTTNITAKQIA